MDVPEFVFSDWLVPPLKTVKSSQLADLHDPGKRTRIPIAQDGYFEDIFSLPSLVLKNPTTPNFKNTVMVPSSPCLPFGEPNQIANLQDLCSGVLPFAIRSQEWIRSRKCRKPTGRPRGSLNKKRGKWKDENSFEEIVHAPPKPSQPPKQNQTPKQNQPPRIDEEEVENEELSFGEGERFFEVFQPLKSEEARIINAGKRAAIYSGFTALPPLHSPVNWWYSGGTLKYLPFSEENGVLLHPSGDLSTLKTLPISIGQNTARIRRTEGQSDSFDTETAIYQIEIQKLDSNFVFVRNPESCLIFELNQIRLEQKLKIAAEPSDYFTHIAPSCHISGEFLAASQKGIVKLWKIDRKQPVGQIDVRKMDFKRDAINSWTGCYVGSFPRSICIATSNAVEIFDGRLRNDSKSQMRLLEKCDYLRGVGDPIVAGSIISDYSDYHAVMTTKELLVVDQRFPINPVSRGEMTSGTQPLRYPSQTWSPSLYLRILKDAVTSTNVVLCGSQLSQQVFVHQIDLTSDFRPAVFASLPFLLASPKSLIPLGLSNDVQISTAAKCRLGKAIIGVEGIGHSDGGLSIALITSLGDLFLQSVEIGENEDAVAVNGVVGFSAVAIDTQLDKKEPKLLRKWIAAASLNIADPTRGPFLKPFGNNSNFGISSKMEHFFQLAATSAGTKPSPGCQNCQQSEANVDESSSWETCRRCHLFLTTNKQSKATSTAPFCFVEENSSDQTPPLANLIDFEKKLVNFAKHNRILWKILSFGYNLKLPTTDLVPKPEDMPAEFKRKFRTRKNDAQTEQMQTLLELAKEAEADEEMDDFMPDIPDAFEPLATSTQKSISEDEMPIKIQVKKSAKVKRKSGF